MKESDIELIWQVCFMGICQAVVYNDLCDAESEYADIWGGEAPDGLYECASHLEDLILSRMVSEAIREEEEMWRELAEELQANCEPDVPEDGDYILSDCGKLGASYQVVQYGVRLAMFEEMGDAQAFIREHIKTEKFWPNVWYQDDHGGITQILLIDGES